MALEAPASLARPTSALSGLWRQIAGQTTLLFAGFATAHGCAFLRNAIMAHVLSRGDFGIAATILMTLQLLETLAETGADKMIVQADDGASPAVVGTAQTFAMARGIATAALLLALAVPLASFFRIPEATPAFMVVALAPLMRGFMNLDMRRAQRALNNKPYMAVEVIPQMLALAVTPLALIITPTFHAVAMIAVVQAGARLIVSHVAAERRISARWDRDAARRMILFAWPIWLSAIPVIITLHGDRMLIARLIDMEAVAAYAAAFMMAMVPGLLMASVANGLLLPLLSEVKHSPDTLMRRARLMTKASVAVAAVYVLGYAVLGGTVLVIAFGPAYSGLGLLVTLLSLMWAGRIIQTVPGVVLMALGRNAVLLQVGCVRALGLIPAYFAIKAGYGVEGVAAAAVLAECAGLAFTFWSVNRVVRDRMIQPASGP